ncbi:hypothetical protein C8Q77DRAFT_1030156, partial [Trametes polyzona]
MGDIKPDSVPILSSATQYVDWSAKMKGLLMFMDCWEVVSGSLTQPSPTDVDGTKAWKKSNAQACGLIYLRTGQSFHYLLEPKTATAPPLTAKEMWEALQAKFGTPNSAHIWALFENLISDPCMSDQKSLQDQISR